MAQGKFNESKKSIEKAQKYDVGQLLLVPLTGSVRYYALCSNLIRWSWIIVSSAKIALFFLPQMYVDGQIAESNSFIINVGTGYYLRKVSVVHKIILRRRSVLIYTMRSYRMPKEPRIIFSADWRLLLHKSRKFKQLATIEIELKKVSHRFLVLYCFWSIVWLTQYELTQLYASSE